jgi:glycine/D-amino acid oxidase-like deaminating enzyme
MSMQIVQALLCGKYVSPLPSDPNLYLVGATFKTTQCLRKSSLRNCKSSQKLFHSFVEEYQRRASDAGYRVQSGRGQLGRMPIIGRLPTSTNADPASDEHLQETSHGNTWIFTGESSRGLLYHAPYGDILTDALLAGSEAPTHHRCKELMWWKK